MAKKKPGKRASKPRRSRKQDEVPVPSPPPPRAWTERDDSFIEALRQAPRARDTRLVYADWLDESGDPARAEFLRIRVEGEKLPADDPRRQQIDQRVVELLREHSRRWIWPEGPWPDYEGTVDPHVWQQREGTGYIRWGGYVLGMIETVEVNLACLMAHGEDLFRYQPIRDIILKDPLDAVEDAARLAELPGLGKVQRLEFTTSSSDALQLLLASPGLTKLFDLHLRFARNVGRALPAGEVRRCVSVLAAAPVLGQVTCFGIKTTPIGTAGMRRLLASPHFHPYYLDLEGSASPGRFGWNSETWDHEYTDGHTSPVVGSEGVCLLLASTLAARLRTLDVKWNGLDDAAIDALLHSPHLGALKKLELAEYEEPFPTRVQELRTRFGNVLLTPGIS